MSLDTLMTEDEDADPVGAPPPRDPRAVFTEFAVDVGLIRLGDRIDDNLMELCSRVVDACAAIGDQYRNPDVIEDTVGDHIRAELLE